MRKGENEQKRGRRCHRGGNLGRVKGDGLEVWAPGAQGHPLRLHQTFGGKLPVFLELRSGARVRGGCSPGWPCRVLPRLRLCSRLPSTGEGATCLWTLPLGQHLTDSSISLKVGRGWEVARKLCRGTSESRFKPRGSRALRTGRRKVAGSSRTRLCRFLISFEGGEEGKRIFSTLLFPISTGNTQSLSIILIDSNCQGRKNRGVGREREDIPYAVGFTLRGLREGRRRRREAPGLGRGQPFGRAPILSALALALAGKEAPEDAALEREPRAKSFKQPL